MASPTSANIVINHDGVFRHLFDVITFDLWQTLLIDSVDQGSRRGQLRLSGIREVLADAGRDYSYTELKDAYNECAVQCRAIRSKLLDIPFDGQIKLFLEALEDGLSESLGSDVFDSVSKIYCDAFFLAPPTLHGKCLEVLSKIAESGAKMALISNTGMTPGVAFRKFLKNTGALRYFEHTVFSDEELFAKPAPEMFHRTLFRVGGSAAKSVHVGDSVHHDVVGAHLVGMKAIWVSGFSERGQLSVTGSEPDVTVEDLGHVPDAIIKMLG